jgi:RNA polymerase sigma factor (sigma-70 family)
MSDGNKTEKATPRRRQKAREQGQIARSRDLIAGLGSTVAVLILGWELPRFGTEWHALLERSLDMAVSHAVKEEDLCDYVPSAPEETPFFRCLRSEMRDLLAKVIAELPEKEQQVLSLYYFEELTMKEVGAVLGIGESRVSQIHSLAVVRLRSRLEQMMAGKDTLARATSAASGE